MTKALFSVGEEVILQSKDEPRYNGDGYTVDMVVHPGEDFRDPVNSKMYNNFTTDIVYIIHPYIMVEFDDDDDGGVLLFKESSLRKKHQPGEMSFSDLMQKITCKDPA